MLIACRFYSRINCRSNAVVWRSEKYIYGLTQPLFNFKRNSCILINSVDGFSVFNIANGYIKKNEVFNVQM